MIATLISLCGTEVLDGLKLPEIFKDDNLPESVHITLQSVSQLKTQTDSPHSFQIPPTSTARELYQCFWEILGNLNETSKHSTLSSNGAVIFPGDLLNMGFSASEVLCY
eukprot:Phypoly_transcript_20471.p1 GENE.Phypoly_transcript_20471~~Phypoly_transcript_20471.p1  ORF type:complete len:109 (+),score=15.95 Phypoly_transcript_20471:222-548(+)